MNKIQKLVIVSLLTTALSPAATFNFNAAASGPPNPLIARSSAQGAGNLGASDFWNSQVRRLDDMNTDFVRKSATVSVSGTGAGLTVSFTTLDPIVDSIVASGAKPYLFFEVSLLRNRPAGDAGLIAQKVAKHYKGKVTYFEVFNEPDGPNWALPIATANSLYKEVADKIKHATNGNPDAKLGGMGLAIVDAAYMLQFITFVKDNGLALDFVSWHFYPTTGANEYWSSNLEAEVEEVDGWLTGISPKPEIHINEFNVNALTSYSKLDEAFDASWTMQFIKDVDLMTHKPDKIFFFQPKDLLGPTRFRGSWGMMTNDGYPKPVYNALKMYGTMPTTTKFTATPAAQVGAVGTMASRENYRIEVLVWNNSNRAESVTVNMTGLGGSYTYFTRTLVDDRSGNSNFNVHNAELAMAEEANVPTSSGNLNRTFILAPNGVTKLSYRAQASAPAAPQSVSATILNQKAAVSWNESTNAVSYRVGRATNGGTFSTIAIGVTGSTYIDSTINQGTPYSYKVTAVNSGGSSTGGSASASVIWPTTGGFDANYLAMPPRYSEEFGGYGTAASLGHWIFGGSGGTWANDNGALYQSDPANYPTATMAGLPFTDGTISVDIKMESGSWAGFEVRKNTSTDGYKIILWNSGVLQVFQNSTELGSYATHLRPLQRVENLKCVLNGTSMKIYAAGYAYFVTNSATVASGSVKLRTGTATARFSNLQITGADFADDFSVVSDGNWNKYNGTWTVGTASPSTDPFFKQTNAATTDAYASLHAVKLQDGTVEADVKIDSGTGWAGIALMRNTPEEALRESGYMVYLRNTNQLGIYRCALNGVAGSQVYSASLNSGVNVNTGLVKLKVVSFNGGISVYVNGTFMTTYTDRTFTSGSVALATSGVSARFDNVIIKP